MQEVYLRFLQGALPKLIHLYLLLQRSDPIIHYLYVTIFDTSAILLSRFVKPDVVIQYKNHLFTDMTSRI